MGSASPLHIHSHCLHKDLIVFYELVLLALDCGFSRHPSFVWPAGGNAVVCVSVCVCSTCQHFPKASAGSYMMTPLAVRWDCWPGFGFPCGLSRRATLSSNMVRLVFEEGKPECVHA